MSRFSQLQQLEALIPASTPYVLFQNDMPGMLPRPLDYLRTPLVSGIGAWQNVSLFDATRGTFPYLLYNGDVVSARVDYMIDDPYNWGFTEVGSIPNNSMYHFVRVGYESGHYGILGEVGGMVVFERAYTAGPSAYSPFAESIPASELSGSDSLSPSASSTVAISNASGGTAWNGPFIPLSPGRYTVRFSLRTTDVSPTNHIDLTVTAELGSSRINLTKLVITGANFTSPNVWNSISLPVYVNDTYQAVAFPGLSADWTGTLEIQGVQVIQTAPGSPTYL
jgi:hypothetical protein